jgi:hypothetical protein
MLTYRIDSAKRLVVARSTDLLTAAECIEVQNLLRRDSAFDPKFALIADYRHTSLSDFDAAKQRHIVNNVPFDPAARRAFVAENDASYSIIRMFEAISAVQPRGGCVKAFRDLQAAMQWLEQGTPNP